MTHQNEQSFLLPCPICNGVEGCDHTVLERARAASAIRRRERETSETLEFKSAGLKRRRPPMDYRGFSIERERDGSFSVFRFGYISGNHRTVEAAKKDIDGRALS